MSNIKLQILIENSSYVFIEHKMTTNDDIARRFAEFEKYDLQPCNQKYYCWQCRIGYLEQTCLLVS